jgi:hypothetical protein
MKLLSAILATGLLALSGTAAAQGNNDASEGGGKKKKKESMHDQLTGQGYGLAGCGLGSIVFGPKPGMIQVIAATINGTAGSQTFGISSGTSNCDMPEMGMAAASFIEVNREVVAKDAARGEGESLDNLATIFKCSNFPMFREAIKNNYENVFVPANNSYDSSRAIISTIQSNPVLAQSCARIG